MVFPCIYGDNKQIMGKIVSGFFSILIKSARHIYYYLHITFTKDSPITKKESISFAGHPKEQSHPILRNLFKKMVLGSLPKIFKIIFINMPFLCVLFKLIIDSFTHIV